MVANCNVPISVNDEKVSDVVSAVLSKVAVPAGTAGAQLKLSLQLPLADPVQVASCACARFGASIASEPSQTLPSSAARVTAGRAADIANSPAWPRIEAAGARRSGAGRLPLVRTQRKLITAASATRNCRTNKWGARSR